MFSRPSIFFLAVIFTLLTCISNTRAQYGSGRERVRVPGRGRAGYHAVNNGRGVTRGDQPPPFEPEDPEDLHPLTELAAHWYPQTGRIRGYTPTRSHPCEKSSCYPATGNLLIGREKQLMASSTCGLYGQKRYCIVSHLKDPKKCFWCETTPRTRNNPSLNHDIKHIVEKYYPGTENISWWQSENGKENVTIQLDLEAEFHFTHLIIVFKTFRPAAMLIERSYDFGKTWQVYRYFAHNCEDSFPGVPNRLPQKLSDVVCESRYSHVAPSTGGEIIFRVLPPHLPIDNPYSQEVQNLLKMTNLRVNFTKLHTLGDDLLDKREEIQEKYYYAISGMIVRGSCSCYGHAYRCLPLSEVEDKPDMVHGRCECTHNTKGRNCELCEDFFNDLPWKPAIGKKTNACKRCNCNNHANTCHFDEAVYELSGSVSGGVCDNCQHNTMGVHCEQCKDYFYHEPTKDIQDPEACRPCDCDPFGSLDGGVCDTRTDAVNGLEAGRCHCKVNVDGRRCDTCKNGYWNFTETNPEGCQNCTCNILGTINNQGCNVYTGECTCKRYVTGRDCNQCLPEYWGLSEKRDGCQPCDCDPGGSLDNSCDVITGQCSCRDHVQGRTCNQPKQQYFTGAIDFHVYEAELVNASSNCQVVIREPYRDGRENTWTGTGFMRAFEGSHMEFIVEDIQTSMDYDIVVRYEPQLRGVWDDVTLTVVRPERIDQNGQCGNSRPEDDIKRAVLGDGQRYTVVYPPVCLEVKKQYKIIVDFNQFRSDVDSRSPSVLIDSIVLIPRIKSIPFFRGSPAAENRRQDYERYHCGEYYYGVENRKNIPDICKQYDVSIGFYAYGGAYPCSCHKTGSVSTLCDDYGGRCQCKKGVVGRKCERCAPGYYGLNQEGCTPCECNSIGALDNFCDANSGQCRCHPNTYGRQCDQCQPGYWNFPNCQKCECNGLADTCDSRTGACINCRNLTIGHACDRCIDGYYGDPRIGIAIPCRACPCPGTIGSGHSYADRCALDPHTKDVVCECQEGYAGSRCDVCSDNYFGHPELPGGSCQPCKCNNNVDIAKPGNCDPRTGKCLQCLFYTEGDHCEICKANFYGDAINQLCEQCVCEILGTDSKAGPCDRTTGQCPCLNNVIGKDCSQCKENHWKIASGEGCEPCDCDPVGSVAEQCNLFDGQCECRPGFGGRQCNQCQANHWGNPNVKCHSCDCDSVGSLTPQCHRENGSCVCQPGIGGDKCNVCARGYLGEAPYCSHCGECFTNWDLILNERREQTEKIIQEASKIKKVGAATGAYFHKFEEMEKKLKDVRHLLENTTVSNQDVDDIDNNLVTVRNKFKETNRHINDTEKKLINATQGIELSRIALDELKTRTDLLKNKTEDFKENATLLKEADVEGALALTQNAWSQVNNAERKVVDISGIILEAERQCKAAESLVNRSRGDEKFESNNQQLDSLHDELDVLKRKIPFLNEQMCDKQGDPCDQLCGGAGCGTCGGISCEDGAVVKVTKALLFAENAAKNIREKEVKAEELLRAMAQVNKETNEAHTKAKEAYDRASEMDRTANETLQDTINVIKGLQDVLNNNATPTDIRKLSEEVLSKRIDLEPYQIKELAESINQTVASLTDIDKIISETSGNLTRAKALKEDAERAKKEAEDTLDTAQRVVTALEEAESAQSKAQEAIDKANVDIEQAEEDLTEISTQSKQAQAKANDTVEQVKQLNKRLKTLQTKYLKNRLDANDLQNKSKEVIHDAQEARSEAELLQTRYNKVNSTLGKEAERSYATRNRAQDLKTRANKLIVSINGKLESLQDLKIESSDQEHKLKNVTAEINLKISEMNTYLNEIRVKSTGYRSCYT